MAGTPEDLQAAIASTAGSNLPDAAVIANAADKVNGDVTVAVAAAAQDATAAQGVAKAAAAAGSPAVPVPVAQVGFVLFYLLFALLGVMAFISNSDTITGTLPAIVTALLGLVINPTAGVSGSPPKSLSWAQPPWRILIIVGGMSTIACATAMIWGHHAAAEGSFEVAAGGLFGLLIDTSQLSPFQGLLTAVGKALGANMPEE